ncbi:MAG TPA: hypothetical protein PKA63_13945 [Oligoflexia bacterium]|nr:hypothetical protein [Oligoflexia bacterium]HMP49766.1 hypothetical protein [Oligoflexia bacterium]
MANQNPFHEAFSENNLLINDAEFIFVLHETKVSLVVITIVLEVKGDSLVRKSK